MYGNTRKDGAESLALLEESQGSKWTIQLGSTRSQKLAQK